MTLKPVNTLLSKRKRRYPVSSFGPEMMAALKKGAVEKIVLKFPDLKTATFFHHRLHTLRSAMREEQHPDAELVSRARASKVWGAKLGEAYANDFKGQKACHVVIEPNDAQFSAVLDAAGVKVEAPQVALTQTEQAALAPLEVAPPVVGDPYADFKGGDGSSENS